jgi:predicted NBD/HSP70 family sugar kinase
MYLGIDIGGTKTLVASLDDNGVIIDSIKFPTPKTYPEFLSQLHDSISKLPAKDFIACGVGAPGKIDREHGIALVFGNLGWTNTPLQQDIQRFVHCPVIVDNDANLAGLSEAMLHQQHQKVLYVTVSTGIGTGFITNRKIDPDLADSEGGQMPLEHNGKIQAWEDFASGRAIVKRFGKRASDITDEKTWRIIAHDVSIGLIDLIALYEPDVVILGGGVGAHLDRFKGFLESDLAAFENPMLTIPPVEQAQRPELAVVYGCYDLAKAAYGQTT